MKHILEFMLPFCQLTGSCCWEPNQSCNNFVSQFNSCKLFSSCISFLCGVLSLHSHGLSFSGACHCSIYLLCNLWFSSALGHCKGQEARWTGTIDNRDCI